MKQKQSNLCTCLGRGGTLCSGTPRSASTVVGSASDATTLYDTACTDCSLDELRTWLRAGSLFDSALVSVFFCPSAVANGLCDSEGRLSRFSLRCCWCCCCWWWWWCLCSCSCWKESEAAWWSELVVCGICSDCCIAGGPASSACG